MGEVKYAIGTSREQVGPTESRPGGGLKLLFEYFDEKCVVYWIGSDFVTKYNNLFCKR